MRRPHLLVTLLTCFAMLACGDEVTKSSDAGQSDQADGGEQPKETFSIGGTVAGLSRSGLVLLNGSDELSISENGAFTFPTKLLSGTAYAVQVQAQPTGQTCSVVNGSGTIGITNVTSVQVSCILNRYSVGGTLDGVAGSGLVLQNNGVDALSLTVDGLFTFGTEIESGQTYHVTVAVQPTNPTQECVVAGGMGTVTSAPVTSVSVLCTTSAFAVGGEVTGLLGELVLETNGQELTLDEDGLFAFTTGLESGTAYDVSVKKQPTGQTCVVTDGTGTVASGVVSDIEVHCTTHRHPIGGTVNGLLSGTLVLQLDAGSQTETLTTTGDYAFDVAVDYGTAYTVTIGSQPAGQTCELEARSGTMPDAPVTNVNVTCTPNLYSLTGTMTGLLPGHTVVIQTSPMNKVTVSTNATFTFPADLPFSSDYTVSIVTSSTGQTCTLEHASGTVGAANIDNLEVTCTTNSYTVGGTVLGLKGTLVLQLNNGETKTLTNDDPFTFPTTLLFGTDYTVTITSLPQSPSQTCTLAHDSGKVGAANITDLEVTCTTNTYAVGGTVSGLAGSGLKLTNSGMDELSVTTNGGFVFNTAVASGRNYNVAVSQQPSNLTQRCEVIDGSGPVTNGPISDIMVVCTTSAFALGGTVTGLMGTVVLQSNGQELSLSSGGPFAFTNSLDSGTDYNVTVKTQPIGETCTIPNGTGTITSGPVSGVQVNCTPKLYTIGGSVSGLLPTHSMVLQTSPTNQVTVSSNTTFTLPNALPYNSSYTLSVVTQPAGHTCTVTTVMPATVPAANVTNLEVNCTPNQYTVGGSVAGLIAGHSVVLQTSPTNQVTVSSNTTFTFPSSFAYRSTFTVSIVTQPTGQTCTLSPTTEQTMPAANVTSIKVNCTPNLYTIGGTVTGLVQGHDVTLQVGPTNQRIVQASSPTFTLPNALPYNSSYSVTIAAHPSGQTCTVTTAMPANVPAANVTNIEVNCTLNNYTIGGSVTGLIAGHSVELQIDPSNKVTMTSNTTFTFPNPLPYRSSYSITVTSQPTGETCTLSPGGLRAVPNANVTNNVVTCTPNTYTVGGNVSGIGGTTKVTLSTAGGNSVTVGNGPFTFPNPLAYNSNYTVSVATHPAGQLCTVSPGTQRTMPASNVNDLSVSCACRPGYAWDGTACTGRFTSFDGGSLHTCGVRSDGTLWCWGLNQYGQLGDGTTTQRTAPVQVGTAKDWSSVDTGEHHTCALRNDNTLWCWGRNNYGQLGLGTGGNGSTETRTAPEQVGSATNWSSISSGRWHTCGIRSDRTLWCWGQGGNGRIGDGTTNSRLSPVQVGTLTTWSSVSAGESHTCGTRTDRTLWCWGDGWSGMLGDGDTQDRLSPVRELTAATNWTSVSAGDGHTCGTRADQSLWCWGVNASGELGDGTTTYRVSPVRLTSSDFWSGSVAAGSSHSCGIINVTRPSVWCWGLNVSGQLGDGTSATERPSPVRVGLDFDWAVVKTGYHHTCALRTDNKLFCWGSNTSGQLGDGTTTNRNLPTAVIDP